MKKWISGLATLLVLAACASTPVSEQEIDAAKGEARTINNKFSTACVSLGLPEGSTPYVSCVLDFYVRENAEASERRTVLTEALKRQTRNK